MQDFAKNYVFHTSLKVNEVHDVIHTIIRNSLLNEFVYYYLEIRVMTLPL